MQKYAGCRSAETKSKPRKHSKERKEQIYVHDLSRIPTHGFMKTTVKKPSFTMSNNSKSLLDRLEESYWATWKPQKESIHDKTFRRHNKSTTKNTAYGDTADHLIKYFGSVGFDTSSVTIHEMSEQEVCEKCDEGTSPELETHSQEIQTESLSEFTTHEDVMASKIQKPVKEHSTKKEKSSSKRDRSSKKHSTGKKEETKEIDKTTELIVDKPLESILEAESEPKVLIHTDSLIIAKKKQSEIKEAFQQPKCIKLHKNTPSSLIPKGGMYQTKPCFRRESSQLSHFRLGAPGSTLFVTANSFNKKYMH